MNLKRTTLSRLNVKNLKKFNKIQIKVFFCLMTGSLFGGII